MCVYNSKCLGFVCVCVCVYLNSMGGSRVDVQSRGCVVCVWSSAQCGWRREANSVTGVRQTCNITEGKVSLVYTHTCPVQNYSDIGTGRPTENSTHVPGEMGRLEEGEGV